MKKCLKWILAVLSLSSILFFTACDAGTAKKSDSIYEQGLAVITLMDQLALEGDAFTTDAPILTMLDSVGHSDRGEPKAVYRISISEEKINAYLGIAGTHEISESVRQYLNERVLTSACSVINGRAGTEAIAASSICSASRSFVDGNFTENTIYLYTFEDAAPAAVVFIKGMDGAVAATGTFILNTEYSYNSAEDIKTLFEFISAEVEEIEAK